MAIVQPSWAKKFRQRFHSIASGNMFSSFTFIAAYKGEDDTQNIAIDGTTLNLMPKGVVTSTSIHSTPIQALDYQGIYREYPVDAPVWRGGRQVGSLTYATDDGDVLIDPHPWLQANDAATNLHHHSRNLTNWVLRGVATASYNQIGIGGVANTASLCHVTQKNAGDIYTAITVTLNAPVIAKLYIKAVSTTGLLYIQNQANPSGGRYIIDMSLVSTTDFEVITESHPAVTSFTQFSNVKTNCGHHIFTDTGAIDFIMGNAEWHENITESEALAIPPIFTTTATVSIPALNYVYPAANIDPADSTIELDFLADGRDCDILDIGGHVLLEYLAGDIILADASANSTTVAVANGTRALKIELTATTMQLTVDGTSEIQTAYTPITAGIITSNATHYELKRSA